MPISPSSYNAVITIKRC